MSAHAAAPEPNWENIEEACQMARNLAKTRGYQVFPCNEDKSPASFNGFKDATRDIDGINRLWRRHPGPLVGIATGEASGIDVLDVDVEHELAVKWFAIAQKRIPPTLTYATRRGGHHLYFQHASGVRNSQSKLADGVDVRGCGGYVISWFAAGLECEDPAPVMPWPAWLLECVLWKPTPPPLEITRSFKPEHAEKAIEGVLRIVTGAKEGQRNACLHWAARRMAERIQAGQIGKDEATALLKAAALSVGLLDREASATIASAWRSA